MGTGLGACVRVYNIQGGGGGAWIKGGHHTADKGVMGSDLEEANNGAGSKADVGFFFIACSIHYGQLQLYGGKRCCFRKTPRMQTSPVPSSPPF
jgi:hypothetical protein